MSTYDEFKSVMEGRPGFVIAGWCGSAECEAQIKADTQATLRNIPFGGRRRAGHLREMRAAVAGRGVVREGVLICKTGQRVVLLDSFPTMHLSTRGGHLLSVRTKM